MPKKKKKESRSPFMTFLYIILVIPYRIASGFIKLLIGVPIGLFASLVGYSKKHY